MQTRGEGFRAGSARWSRLAPPLHALLGAGARRCAATARNVPDRTAFERRRSDHGRARYGRRNRGIRLIYCLHEVPRQLPLPRSPRTRATRARHARTLGNHAQHARRAGRPSLAGNPHTGATKSAQILYAPAPCGAYNCCKRSKGPSQTKTARASTRSAPTWVTTSAMDANKVELPALLPHAPASAALSNSLIR